MIVRLSFQYKNIPIEIELEEGLDFLKGQRFNAKPLAQLLDSVKRFIDEMTGMPLAPK